MTPLAEITRGLPRGWRPRGHSRFDVERRDGLAYVVLGDDGLWYPFMRSPLIRGVYAGKSHERRDDAMAHADEYVKVAWPAYDAAFARRLW